MRAPILPVRRQCAASIGPVVAPGGRSLSAAMTSACSVMPGCVWAAKAWHGLVAATAVEGAVAGGLLAVEQAVSRAAAVRVGQGVMKRCVVMEWVIKGGEVGLVAMGCAARW